MSQENLRKVGRGSLATLLQYQFVDSTAMLAPFHWIFSAFETTISGMEDETSLLARLYLSGLTYLGLGRVVTWGRDLSRKKMQMAERSERLQGFHDATYVGLVNIPIAIGLYLSAGETDLKKIAIGTAAGAVTGMLSGPLVGGSIDVYRDLAGIERCKRNWYPQYVNALSARTKKWVAAGITAAGIGAMCAVYASTPDRLEYEWIWPEATLEEVVNSETFR